MQYILTRAPISSCLYNTAYLNTSAIYLSRHSPTHYYDVLGITPKATHKQIKDAFYKLSRTHHPDVSGDSSSVAKFQEISEAYEILGNHFSRKKYDRGLLNPTDRRSEHQASRDDDADIGFRPRKYQKREAVFTGKTKYYNFDEYYRQHYGEQVLQQFKKKQANSSHQKKAEPQNSTANDHPVYDHISVRSLMSTPSGSFITMGLLVALLMVFMLDSDFVKDLEKSPVCESGAARRNSTPK